MERQLEFSAPADCVGPWPAIDLAWLSPPIASSVVFPLQALPPQLSATVADFATARRLCHDFVAGAILGAASAAIGNRARLLGFDGCSEPLSLFIALIGWPGTGKSSAISLAEAPLSKIEDALHNAYEASGVATRKLSALAASFSSVVSRRLSHEGIDNHTNQYVDTPESPGLLISEFSAAGLLDELKGGQNGRAIVVDELTGALAVSSGAAGLKARALLLQGFDGKPYRKRTATHGSMTVPALQIAILGGTQPDRVQALVGRVRDGLVPRFLWLAPEVEPSAQMAQGSGPVETLQNALACLVRIQPASDINGYARLIPLAASARKPLEAAAQLWAAAQKNVDPAGQDVIARARQQALRLSGVMAQFEHALSGGEGAIDELTELQVERGLTLMQNYFLPMAERTFALANVPRESDAVRVARYLRRLGRPLINLRDDLHRGAGSPVRTPAAVGEAIAELKARNFVREAPRDPHGRGRPSVVIEINPALFTL